MVKAVGVVLALFLLAGCTAPVVVPPADVELEIMTEDQGWVQMRVTGVSTLGYTLWWGDADTSYGVSDVVLPIEVYEHFYQAVDGGSSGSQIPTDYEITVRDGDGGVIAEESVHIERADCHLALVTIGGRMVTVRYWGRFGIDYSVSWGDQTTDHITVDSETGTGLLYHTYKKAGTYGLGMSEIWGALRMFFSVTIE